LVEGVDRRLKKIITEVCREWSARIIEMEVMPDHVRLLVEAEPQFGIHRLVKLVKGRPFASVAPRISVAEEPPADAVDKLLLRRHGGWRAPLAMVKKYIESQKGV
jgi:putative transposase